MSGSQTVNLDYVPDGQVLVKPNAPLTIDQLSAADQTEIDSRVAKQVTAQMSDYAPVTEPVALTKEPAISRGAAASGTVPVLQADGTLAFAPVSVSNSQIATLGTEVGYPHVFVDVNNRLLAYVDATGHWNFPGSITVPNGSIPLAQLAQSVQNGIGQIAPAEVGMPFVFTDSAGRLLAYIGSDGTLTPSKFAAPAGSITLAMLAPSVQAGLPASMPTETGFLEAHVDSAGRLYGGVKVDGSAFGKGVGPAGGPVEIDSNYVVDTITDSNGNQQIRVVNRSTQTVKLLTSVGRNVDPVLATINGVESVIYRTDGAQIGGKYTTWFRPADGSAPAAPVTSLLSPLVGWGDSLTAGTNSNPTGQAGAYPNQLGTMLGTSVVNRGAGGQTSEQIAARDGGTPATVTFASNTIAAGSSPQTVTVSVDLYYSAAGGFSGAGTIGGAHGTLASGGTSGATTAYTFTRDDAGGAVTLSGATNFIPDDKATYAAQWVGVWVGRNNFKTDPASQIVSDAQSIVNTLTPINPRFWVLAIPPWVGEETTTTNLTAPSGVRYLLDTANSALQSQFPNNWICDTNLAGSPLMNANPGLAFADSAAFLRTSQAFTIANAAYPACPATPTAQDTTDISNGITPTTFRTNTSSGTVDAGHFNEYGYYLIAYLVYQFVTAKGWLL